MTDTNSSDSESSQHARTGRSAESDQGRPPASAHQAALPPNLMIHIGSDDRLLDIGRDDNLGQTTDLVIAPVELHRRNIQRRYREAGLPSVGLQIVDHTTLAAQLLDADNRSTVTLDRIDRLSMIEALVAEDSTIRATPGVPSDPQSLEQMCTDVEFCTGFHPERLEALTQAIPNLPTPIDDDVTEILNTAMALEGALRKRTERAVSDIELLRRAVRLLWVDDGRVWQETFPSVDRISVVGTSNLPAALIDLVHAILTVVPGSIPVHIHLRSGSGRYLSRRIPHLLSIDTPGAVVFDE